MVVSVPTIPTVVSPETRRKDASTLNFILPSPGNKIYTPSNPCYLSQI
jgi:hypothetical protein